MRMTETQLAEFNTQGFLNVGTVFSDAELGEIRGEYDRLVRA